jgi:hypothetical protein
MLVRQAETAGRLMSWPVEEIELASLNVWVLAARRPHLIERRVQEYMVGSAIDEGGPVVVYCDPGDGGSPASGHHRVEAARRNGRTTIWAELRVGNKHQATTYPDHSTPRS